MVAVSSGQRGSGLAFAGHGGVGSGAEEQLDAFGAAGFGRIHECGRPGKVPGILRRVRGKESPSVGGDD